MSNALLLMLNLPASYDGPAKSELQVSFNGTVDWAALTREQRQLVFLGCCREVFHAVHAFASEEMDCVHVALLNHWLTGLQCNQCLVNLIQFVAKLSNADIDNFWGEVRVYLLAFSEVFEWKLRLIFIEIYLAHPKQSTFFLFDIFRVNLVARLNFRPVEPPFVLLRRFHVGWHRRHFLLTVVFWRLFDAMHRVDLRQTFLFNLIFLFFLSFLFSYYIKFQLIF